MRNKIIGSDSRYALNFFASIFIISKIKQIGRPSALPYGIRDIAYEN